MIINNSDELVELVEQAVRKLPDDHKKKLEQALWDVGIGEKEEINTIQLSDFRTINIIENFLYYRNDPSRAYESPPKIWFESVIILQNIFQTRLF